VKIPSRQADRCVRGFAIQMGMLKSVRLVLHYTRSLCHPESKSMSQDSPAKRYDAAIKLKSQGDLEACIQALNALLVEFPDHVQTHMALAVSQQKQGRFDEAISHAKRVTELEPNDAFSFTQLSVIYQRCGKIFEAEDAMARARLIQGTPQRH